MLKGSRLVSGLILTFCLAIPSALLGQVIARQGEVKDSPLHEFTSPMILEMPIKDLPVIAYNGGQDLSKQVQEYYCDGLVISKLLLTKKKDAHRGEAPGLRLEFRGSVTVRPSHDRLATIRFEVINGIDVVASTEAARLNAEEGKATSFSAKMRLSAEDVKRVMGEGKSPSLRLTVAVADNN